MKEIKKKLEGCDGYRISNMGNVYGRLGAKLKPYVNPRTGRLLINVRIGETSRSKTIHTMVAEHFLKNSKGKLHVMHKDGDIHNNKTSNLKWSYQCEYTQEAQENRRKIFQGYMGKKHWKARPFKAEGKTYYTLREASEELEIPLPTVQARLQRCDRPDYAYLK